MRFRKLKYCMLALFGPGAISAAPTLPGVGAAISAAAAQGEVAGAVAVVVTKDTVRDAEAVGFADLAAGRKMQINQLFWIASMTKPITGVAVLMLQDDGKLDLGALVAKYLPAFGALKTPSGRLAQITVAQLLTHTSGLGEVPALAGARSHTLADLTPLILAAPMQSEPGARWKYCQAGINTAARLVEVVSGMSYDAFVHRRILDPLGMNDTTFRRIPAGAAPLATAYAKNRVTGRLEPVPPRPDIGLPDEPPYGSAGLYSTGPDYARFCQMLLGGGIFHGRRYLSSEAMRLLTTVQTGTLETGFLQSPRDASRGADYGYGIGTCVLRRPHPGVAAMLSPGTFGHGGAWGTQAWIDPVRGVAYVLMVQRTNFPNGDNSELRRAFQAAAALALNP
jgi:CubicO group peptidase (beta-lactamase class C family)